MRKLRKLLLGTALTTAVIVACQPREIDNETQSAKDSSYAEMSFSQIAPLVNQIGIDEEGVEKTNGLEACANITIQETVGSVDGFPKTVTVDYGVACVGNDGRTRSGKVFIVYSTNWSATTCDVDVSFENYHINTIKHEGFFHIVKSTNASGNKVFTVELTDGKIHTQEGIIEYNSTRSTEWLAGDATSDVTDDHFIVSGNSYGVNREGRNFSTVITTPLVRKATCEYITEGVFELTPEGLATRIIDFGDGTCDNKATITVNDNTIEFPLD